MPVDADIDRWVALQLAGSSDIGCAVVVGSQSDTIMPPDRLRDITEALPAGPGNQLFMSPSAIHGSCFREPDVASAIQTFVRSRGAHARRRLLESPPCHA